MRKTCFGGLLLLCVLTAAKPARAAAQETLPETPAVETVFVQEEAVLPEDSAETPAANETAADVPDPDENDEAAQSAPAAPSLPEKAPELKDDSDLNNGSVPEDGSDLMDDSALKEDSGSENETAPAGEEASAPTEEEVSVPETTDEDLTAEAVSVPDEPDTGIVNAQDNPAAMKPALNAATGAAANEAVEKTEDRIHFITLNTEKYDSDAILVESNGKYGLIDSSNPSDLNDKYSDQKANGLAVVRYLTDINVDHLTFILATHSHSDHVGGMPDVAASGLVDSRTVYIYKPCETPNEGRYNNNYYYNSALEAMVAQGAALLNVQERNPGVMLSLGATFTEDPNDRVGDHISFNLGDFLISLFNLHTESYTNENLNSIVTTVKKNDMRAVLMADMEMADYMESRTVKCINRNDGTSRTDVYKMGHHHFDTSNSLDTINTLNPRYCVQTTISTNYRSNSGTIYYYLINRNGKRIYRTSQNSPAIIADFGDRQVSLLRKASNGSMAAATPWNITLYNGFYSWYPDEESYNKTGSKLTFLRSGAAVKGWFQVGDNWYYADKNFIVQTGWQWLDNKEYYFNSSGVMQTGWLSLNGNWYYFNGDGAMKTGWVKYSGKWYYFERGGAMVTGWRSLDGKTYYFNSHGIMQTGWVKDGGKWYYLNSSGSMKTGWFKDGGKWYYLDGTGAMATGWRKLDGKTYYFNGSGVMQTGWVKDGGKWYYLSSSGVMKTGWLSDDGKWYYLDGSTGAMVTGWRKLDGKTYYFNGSGVMKTGWVKDGGKWYYLSSSGAMKTGWLKDGGSWYYLDGSTGAMATGWRTVGSLMYYFNGSGVMKTGWISSNGKWYYLDNAGAMVTNRWVGDYYLKSNGEMAVNQWIGSYYVGSDGKWIKNYKAS